MSCMKRMIYQAGRNDFPLSVFFFTNALKSSEVHYEISFKTLLLVPSESCPEAFPRNILKIGQSNCRKKLEQAAFLKTTSLCVRRDE